MRITVITPYDYPNYGAYLQAYCLKHKLEELGHEVYHMPTCSEEYVRSLFFKKKPTRKKEKLFRLTFQKNKQFGMRKYEKFRSDIAEFHSVKEGAAKADLYILGSDEIWNVNSTELQSPIFWGIGINPVISYAASIGGADIETLKKYPEQINAVRKLKAALVRDKRTVEFVEQVAGRQAQIVCDPTMLVPVENYGREFRDEYLEKNNCLLVYAYTKFSKTNIEAIKAYAKQKGLKVVGCCFNHSWCDHICECSPLEFSSLIRQCRAVVTATFHGSIFCMLNHADFVSISYSPKTPQLLEQFGLRDRCLEIGEVTQEAIAKLLDGSEIDYSPVEEKIAAIRSDSVRLLSEAIENAVGGSTFDYQICPSDQCSGCFACMNKCPKDAIGVTKDIYGRTLPLIDPEKCIQCGLCKKVCPQNTPVALHTPLKCYAAVRKDEEAHKKSASGGIGAVLSEAIIADGGVVYGAAFENEGELILKHSKASTAEEAEKFRGSKYVQSYIGDIYRDVLSELKTGKKVLFTGTPCQIGGLKSYLGKDYDNLYCMDLICHGVPPMEYLSQHIDAVAGDKKVTDVTFRIGKRDFVIYVKSGSEVVYTTFREQDTYYTSFIRSQDFRENCYHCQYAAPDRCSDISVGDYWLDKKTLKHPMPGKITVVTVNTAKGQQLVDEMSSEVVMEERDYEEAKSINEQLNHPSIKYKDREKLLRTFRKTQDIEKAINATCIRREIKQYNFEHGTVPGKVVRKLKYIKKSGKWK